MILATAKLSQHKLLHQQKHDGDLLEGNHNLAQLYAMMIR